MIKVACVIDGNIITGNLRADSLVGLPDKIILGLWHRYEDSRGVGQSIQIDNMTIIRSFYQVNKPDFASFRFLNNKYLDNLSLSVMARNTADTTNTGVLVTVFRRSHGQATGSSVIILAAYNSSGQAISGVYGIFSVTAIDDDHFSFSLLAPPIDIITSSEYQYDVGTVDINVDEVLRESDNPIKEPLHEENTPALPAETNVLVPEPILNTTLVSYVSLIPVKTSKRLFLLDGNFITADYDEAQPTYIENQSVNLATDPFFTGNAYEVEAPGFVVLEQKRVLQETSYVYLQYKLRNPSFLNAFNSATFKPKVPIAITGSGPFTVSMFVQLLPEFGTDTTPVNIVKIGLFCYDNTSTVLSTTASSFLTTQILDWTLLSHTIASLPYNTSMLSFFLEVPDIETNEAFYLNIFCPQLEPLSLPTTRVIDQRIQDEYRTDFVPLKYFSAMVETTHTIKNGIRGLLDSTILGKNGFQWFVSGNTLYLRKFDSFGVMISNMSAPFTATDNTDIKYGLVTSVANTQFLINDAVVATLPPIDLSTTNSILVGSLFQSNTTINSLLKGFGIFQ